MSRKFTAKIKRFFKSLGPGLVTGVSDDDPSGIATYSQAGAQLGIVVLWTALLTFPLMIVTQLMAAKIGIITRKGLMSNIKTHYSKSLMYCILLLVVPAIILNIGADIAGIGAVSNLIFPNIPAFIFAIFFTLLLLVLLVLLPYRKIAGIFKYLCLFIFLYLLVPFTVKQDWLDILKHAFIPHIEFNKEYIKILVAIFGTTISPYLFFWQATMEVEAIRHKRTKISRIDKEKKLIKEMKTDVYVGMLISNVVMFAIILTAASVLFRNGITHIETVEQAAKALEPLAGRFSYLIFSFGIIGTGLLAIPVLSGCVSYMLSAAFNWKEGLDKKYHQARPFYLCIGISLLLGLAINLFGINPIQALIYTAIFYGLSAPILLLLLLHITNNKKIMGEYTNGIWVNIFGVMTFILMSFFAILLIYYH